MKKIFSLLCLTILSIQLFAYDFEVNGIYYNINPNKISVSVTYKDKTYNSYSGNVTIPQSVYYESVNYTVSTIGNEAFRDCDQLFSVELPKSIERIGYAAFINCINLQKVLTNSSKKMTYIGQEAFYGCTSLEEFSIPNTVDTIQRMAFYNCKELTTEMPDSLRFLGDSTFTYCQALQTIKISERVKYIGLSSFKGCISVTSLYYNADSIINVSECYYSYEYNGKLSPVNKHWLEDCYQISEVTIGSNVKYIPHFFLKGLSRLKEITIPAQITWIGELPFVGCTNLEKVTYNAINASHTITRNEKWYSSSNYLYKLRHRGICGIYDLGGEYANDDNSSLIKQIIIGDSVKSLPKYFMMWCDSVTSIQLPNSITTISDSAFYNSGLKRVEIPEKVTSIPNGAFQKCAHLKVVTIPKDVYLIKNHAFDECQMDTIVVYAENPPSFEEKYAIYNYKQKLSPYTTMDSSIYTKIIVPCGRMTYYQLKSSDWTKFLTITEWCNDTVSPLAPPVIIDSVVAGCEGSTFIYNGEMYFGWNKLTFPGFYTKRFITQNAPDTIVNLYLVEKDAYKTQVEVSIFEGESYSFANSNLTTSGTYTTTLQSTAGCDSIITLNLSVIPKFVDTVTIIKNVTDTVTLHDTIKTTLYDTITLTETVTDTIYLHDTITETVTDTLYLHDTITPCGVTRTYIYATINNGETYNNFGFTESDAGEYTLNLQTGDGCDSIVTLILQVTAGIEEIQQERIISIYPNPAKDVVTVDVGHLISDKNQTVTIVNNKGQVIYKSNITSPKFNINVSDFETGVYYIHVGKFTQPLIIE